jgi:DHA3 family macrolide efflux protein-like MFS transporter
MPEITAYQVSDETRSSATSPDNPNSDNPKFRGWHLLKTRDFSLLWSGQLVSQIGDGLNKVALLWFVYELTGSALKMTVIGLLQTLPALVLSPLIGVYLDRLPKKSLMIWIDLARAILVLLIPVLHSLGMLTLNRIYVLVLLTAIASTAFGPALSASVPLIVSRQHLTAGNALIQSGVNIAVLVGPALSGLGIAFIGERNVLFINAMTYFISALCLLPVRFPSTTLPATDSACSQSVISDMVTGFRFVFCQERTILFLMITLVLFNLAWSGFLFLLPVLVQQVLNVGPLELGWLWSFLGVGMLATSAWLACIEQGDLVYKLRMIAGSMAVGAFAVWSLKLFGNAILAAPFVIIIGGCIALVTPVVWSILQEMTPHHMLSRVFTTFSAGGMSAAMVGMLGFGWAVDQLGSGMTLFGIGLLLLGTACVAARFSRLPQGIPVVNPTS